MTLVRRMDGRLIIPVVKMMMVVVVIFAVCWLPYHVYFIVAYHYKDIIESPITQQAYLAIYWMAMSNSMYNPIIYCYMNKRFRRGFRQVFRCYVCIRYPAGRVSRPHNTTDSYSCSLEMAPRSERNGTINIPLNSMSDETGCYSYKYTNGKSMRIMASSKWRNKDDSLN